MRDSGAPWIVERAPPPGVTVPPGCDRLAITFDRPMDTGRGRVRLVWGRIAAHTVNVAARHFRWDVRDPALAWSADGRTLTLQLEPGLCDGFRVRVEWGDLFGAASGLPPLPAEREVGASYVVVFGRIGTGDGGPRLTSLPAQGAVEVRCDPRIELYADRPLAAWDPGTLELTAGNARIPVTVRTNRNPPDWIFVHPEAALPPDADVELRVPALADTGGDLAAPWTLRFRTGAAPPAPAVVDPGLSEPIGGMVDHPVDRVEAALRVRGQVPLADAATLAARIRLVDEGTGARVEGLGIEVDPTPGHGNTALVSSRRGFPGLRRGAWHRLEWDDLGAFGPPSPGAIRFRTVEEGPPALLAPMISAASLFAHPDGTRVQVAAHVHAEGPIDAHLEPWRIRGWRAPLTAHPSPDFNDGMRGELRVAPPRLLSTLEAPPIPRHVATSRFFRVMVRTADRSRAYHFQGFDLGPTVLHADGPRIAWRAATPCDAQHLALLRPDGTPVWAGLYAGTVREAVIPRAWMPPPGDYVAQLWRVRARPSDDVWDYAIADVPLRLP